MKIGFLLLLAISLFLTNECFPTNDQNYPSPKQSGSTYSTGVIGSYGGCNPGDKFLQVLSYGPYGDKVILCQRA